MEGKAMPQEESVLRLGRDEALEAARLWQECGDAREFACRVLGGVMNALMDSEAQQMCGAGRNERSDGRENSRNGYRPRSLKTAVGDVELEIPKLRHGTYYRRSRASAPTSTPRWRSSAAATFRARRAATCGSTPPT